MLLQIGRARRDQPALPNASDPLDELAACHTRILHFTRLAARLGEAPEASDQAIVEAAESVARYYTRALPKHAEDEDCSLAPLLWACDPPKIVRDALQTMQGEHVELDRLVAAAAPRWLAVASDPGSRRALAPDLISDARALGAFWSRHLGLEERVVFPAARALLSPEQLARLGTEMRARRLPAASHPRSSQR